MRINASPVVTRRGPPLVLLALVTALAPAALHMLVPALPMLGLAFDAAPGAVQLVLTLFLAGIAVGQLVYGPVSHRFGRRPVLLAWLTLFSCWHCALRAGLVAAVLIVGRMLAAMGGCAGMVRGRAIVRDVYDRERSASALATIRMVMSLAPPLSPAIGAYLAQWVGWRADFVLLGAVGATVLILTAVMLEETHAPASVDLASMIGSLVRAPARATEHLWADDPFLAAAPYLLAF